jgi:UDP-N-acetylmuramyl pentapeptide phosphotransferase/UDP-N-acetylglucosamine-1-phosphate transferase
MSVGQGVLYFATAAVLSAVGVAGLRRLAPRLHLVDFPNDRSLHTDPTPRGGGLAVVAVCAVGLVVYAVTGDRPGTAVLAGYLGGAVLIALVSAIDDMRPLPVGLRLAVQTVAAVVMAVPLAFGSSALALASAGFATVVAFILTLMWTVGMTNAFNFMDGVDGLVGAQGVVGGIAWAVLASISGIAWQAVLAVLVAGGCLGFLTQNWPPARIFLGDVGSAFLGFTFAFFAVAVPRSAWQLVAAAVIFWPLLFDASITLLRRLRRRENVFAAHRTHLYQRIVLAGGRPATVAVFYAILTLVAAGTALMLWAADSIATRLAVVFVALVESLVLWTVTARVEHRRLAIAAGSSHG